MAISRVHDRFLNAALSYLFDSIRDVRPDVAIYALESIFDNNRYMDPVLQKEFNQPDIDVADCINTLRNILEHKTPQNRNDSYPYVGQEPGFSMYAIPKYLIASVDQEKIILTNGTVIPRTKEHLVRFDEDYLDQPEDATVAVAKEPSGILSLTPQGPIKAEQVHDWIKARSKNLIDEIKEQKRELFGEVKTLFNSLSKGIQLDADATEQDRKDIAFSLQRLKLEIKSTDIYLYRAVVFKLSHVFYEKEELRRAEHESEIDYLKRTLAFIVKQIELNLEQYEKEEKDIAGIKEQLKKIDTEVELKRNHLNSYITSVKDQYWGDALRQNKITQTEFKAQWIALNLKEENLNKQNKSFIRYCPDEKFHSDILVAVRQSKEQKSMITELEQDAELLRNKWLDIRHARQEIVDLNRTKLLQREWLRFLRRGDFIRAQEILDKLTTMKHFNKNVLDEYGRSAIYYALVRNNNLLAYRLACRYEVNVSLVAQQIAINREDLTQALNPSVGMNNSNAWRVVIRNDMYAELLGIVNGVNPASAYAEIERRYSVEWRLEFTDALNYLLKVLADDFWKFSRGFIFSDFSRFEDIYTALNRQSVLQKLCREAHEMAEWRIKKYLEKENAVDLKEFNYIRISFERISENEYFSRIIAEYRANLRDRLGQLVIKFFPNLEQCSTALNEILVGYQKIGEGQLYDKLLQEVIDQHKQRTAIKVTQVPQSLFDAASNDDSKSADTLKRAELCNEIKTELVKQANSIDILLRSRNHREIAVVNQHMQVLGYLNSLLSNHKNWSYTQCIDQVIYRYLNRDTLPSVKTLIQQWKDKLENLDKQKLIRSAGPGA